MMNDRLLLALKGQNRGRPPIWIMRQAGRYLPEYRALRAKHTFLDMCHRPELIVDVTTMPLKRYAFDAAILFSDILLVAETIGRPFEFLDGRGPVLSDPLRSAHDVQALPAHDMTKLHCVADGVRALKQQLQVPLIGFCGGPFTVASYLIEGSTSRDWKKTKRWLFSDPESFHRLLARIADASIDYLNMQIAAGVDAVQIFDSWAHVLALPQFREFSLAYMKRILAGIGNKVPTILFCRGSCLFAEDLASAGSSGIGLDWSGDIADIRKRVGGGITLQGNLDPDTLYAPLDVLRESVERLLESMDGDPAYIFNLGHGISPDMSLEAVQTVVDCVCQRACLI